MTQMLRKEGPRNDIHHSADSALRGSSDDRGPGRCVRRAQRHHQPGAGRHHDFWRVHRCPLRPLHAGPGCVRERCPAGVLADSARPGNYGYAGVRRPGCSLQPAAELRLHQSEGGPDHRRHRPEPDGPRHGAVPHPDHRRPEYPGYEDRRFCHLVYAEKVHLRHSQEPEYRLFGRDLPEQGVSCYLHLHPALHHYVHPAV